MDVDEDVYDSIANEAGIQISLLIEYVRWCKTFSIIISALFILAISYIIYDFIFNKANVYELLNSQFEKEIYLFY